MHDSPHRAPAAPDLGRRRERAAPEVLVVFSTDEDAVEPLAHGARAATEANLPLDLLLLRTADQQTAVALVSMDRALQLVRQACPSLEVRVHEDITDAAGWIRRHRTSVVRLVGSRRTLERLGAHSLEPSTVLPDVAVTAVEAGCGS